MSRLKIVARPAVLAALIALPLGAQEPTPPVAPANPTRPTREMRVEIVRPPMDFLMHRRARLGVSVNLVARATDSIGAYLNGVTPGGPAAKAGLQAGDLITKLDGKSVLDAGGRTDEDQSAPGLRLVELAARLGPSDTVAVEYRRGKDRKTATLITGDDPVFNPPMPGTGSMDFSLDGGGGPDAVRWFSPGHPMPDVLMPDPDRVMMRLGSPLADVELASLNPDLGRYFGTTEGILVVNVGDDSAFGLKGGDVVLAVDGRKPSGPGHLLRILGSYDGGEKFKLDIMRDKKKQTITATAPNQ
jgi:S1-C subfamily serine protease